MTNTWELDPYNIKVMIVPRLREEGDPDFVSREIKVENNFRSIKPKPTVNTPFTYINLVFKRLAFKQENGHVQSVLSNTWCLRCECVPRNTEEKKTKKYMEQKVILYEVTWSKTSWSEAKFLLPVVATLARCYIDTLGTYCPWSRQFSQRANSLCTGTVDL